MVDKGDYRHFMQKEIQEQPEKIEELMMGQLTKGGVNANIFGPTTNWTKMISEIMYDNLRIFTLLFELFI